jgi:hypothetical protein
MRMSLAFLDVFPLSTLAFDAAVEKESEVER